MAAMKKIPTVTSRRSFGFTSDRPPGDRLGKVFDGGASREHEAATRAERAVEVASENGDARSVLPRAVGQDQSPQGAERSEPLQSNPSAWKPVAALLGACGLVATAYYLGAQWLAEPALGVPVGVWGAILAGAWTRMLQTPTRRAWLVDRPVIRSEPSRARAWPRNVVASAALETVAKSASVGVTLLDELTGGTGTDAPSERLSALHDDTAWPERPLRVGLQVPDSVAGPLIGAPGNTPVEFVVLTDLAVDPSIYQRHVLDAVVRGEGDSITLRTAAHYGRDAAWFDWAGQRPLAYSSVFPLRLDPDRVSLGTSVGREQASISRALIEAAATLSRTPQRLNFADRLQGRRPLATNVEVGVESLGAESIHGDLSLRYLAYALSHGELGDARSVGVKAAARAVSAWVATRGGLLEDVERVAIVESAARIAGDEPEVLLRLAASRISAFEDGAGIEALLRAQHLLTHGEILHGADHLSFVQSEIMHGSYGPLTLGRVAAGLCMVCATAPEESLPYLRDDLLEDMRYSGWLVGADADRALLIDVFRQLERARASANRSVVALAA